MFQESETCLYRYSLTWIHRRRAGKKLKFAFEHSATPRTDVLGGAEVRLDGEFQSESHSFYGKLTSNETLKGCGESTTNPFKNSTWLTLARSSPASESASMIPRQPGRLGGSISCTQSVEVCWVRVNFRHGSAYRILSIRHTRNRTLLFVKRFGGG